ncbi:FHA domain-containing protein [Sphaerisporangium corydalis]|uniref:FHA domain-containing protein n=1 Tax=Sphaerisporangium corydalis TaxID=1441875 RepID=A0ABV9E895_9ACTN|nr:FHA domain-containing protein [Sphaerisporangium corydalis]
MRTVLLQIENGPGAGPAAGGPPPLEVQPGREVVFGRGGRSAPVDFPLGHPGVSRRAGVIRAVDDYWLLTNLSRTATLVVENPEGGGEFVKVPPRRVNAPVPFEFARVVVPVTDGSCSFLVFASQHSFIDCEAQDLPSGGDATISAFPLDESAKYFLVLVALCETRLRDCSSSVIPTVPEVLDRLRGVPGCAGLTRAAVNFHIDYLARTKLRVKAADGPGKADWQRAALVSIALRFDLVTERHLDRLEG